MINVGPPNILETTRARKLKLKMPLDIVEYLILVQKFICYGAPRGHMAPSVNLPLPNISEST